MSLNLDKSTWQRVRFGDVARSVNITVNDPESAGVDRVIAMEHLDPGELKIQRWGNLAGGTTFTRLVKPGQTLFGKRRAYQRKVAYADFDAICSGDILVFEADPARLIPELLPFLVQSDGFFDHALGTSAGSLSPRTNWRDLSNYEFPLPGLDEQKRIADLLWAVERHRRSIRAARSIGASAADSMVALELGRRESARRPLPELVREMTVGVVVRPTQYYTDDPAGVPALRGLNIRPDGFTLDELVYFRPESASALSKSTLSAGDVVIVRTGRPGDAAVVNEETAGFNCIDLIIARPGSEMCPEFLAMYLNSTYGRSQISRLSAGTAQQHFNVGALRKLMIPDLARNEQERVVATIAAISRAGEIISREEGALCTLKSSLLVDILGGA